METISTFVFSVGLIIFVAHFFTALFERTRIHDVLPLIFIGIIVGPLFNIVSPEDFGYVGPLLSAVALTLMLFEGGSHLTLETLKGQPGHRGKLVLENGPERIETGWWDGKDIRRDYYIARSLSGVRWWVFQDCRHSTWYLHGLFG